MDNFTSRPNKQTIDIVALTKAKYKRWLEGQSKLTKNWLAANDYKPSAGRIALIPGRDGTLGRVVLGLGKPTRDPKDAALWSFAALPGALPKGRYQLSAELDDSLAHDAALGWAYGTYRFNRYRTVTFADTA